MTDISRPHDKFFRELFSRPEVLRDFLQNYLPENIVALIDTDSAELTKDSFVDAELRDHYSDILCTVSLKSGKSAYVYTLLEHKSYPESAFQLLCSMIRIWEQEYKNYETANDKAPFRLSVIIPIMVYHGKTTSNISEKFQSLFGDVPEMEFGIPDFSYLLWDISRCSDDKIKGIFLLKTALLAIKYIFREDVGKHLTDLLALFRKIIHKQTGSEYLATILIYLAGGTEKISEPELEKLIRMALHPKGNTPLDTLAEKWIEDDKIETLLEVISFGLEMKFGKEGLQMIEEIKMIQDSGILTRILQTLWTITTPGDLRRVYQ
jgi:hypothetical protein